MPSAAHNASSLPRVSIGTTGIDVSRLALGGFHQVEISSDVVARGVDEFLAAGQRKHTAAGLDRAG